MGREEFKEVGEAILDLSAARNNFNEAEPQFIDAAIYNYNAAKSRLMTVIRNARGGEIIESKI